MWGGMMEKGSRGRMRPGAAGGEQQEERGSTGTNRVLSAPLSRRGMGEALRAVVWRRARG